ncbi:lipopolysaccharide biosynthesis protein [Pseudarthrobacter oxydans]|uniref:lipopolysaccharide biosynthesis protein n=1 Tax=Pseudarthrobacter oxydans TaxID=1671 RepID=UPI002AA7D03E|nr:lipopolysaccharide biosynthesis protein [Pseudarthrobacter oxydans]WPU08592.1 lipopolysaccharide biosynthesis protein [Pseudarthrobacter oxydans]
MGLGQAGARGSAITLGSQGVRFIAQIASIAILARILPPSDFGLVTLVIAVISVGELFRDFGLSTAAIQAGSLSNEEKNSLFWVNILIGLGLAGLVMMGAPLAALVFQEPLLSQLLPVTTAAFLINGFQAQFRVELVRSLRFTAVALTELGGHLAGILAAIPLALSGAGVWSLVGQQLIAATVICCSRVFAVRWRPNFSFSLKPAKKFLRTGSQLLVSLLLGYAATNADTVTIGLKLDAGQLGIYSRAYQLVAAPVGQLLSPLTNVGLPLLTRVRSDSRKYAKYILSMFLPLAYTSALLFGFVIGSAQAIVQLLLGEGWEDSARILALLATGGIFQFMSHVGYWVFVSSGNAAAMMRYSLVTHGISVLCIIAGSFFGLPGVAMGYSLGLAMTWPIQVWWLQKLVYIPVAQLMCTGFRALVLALVCAAVGQLSSAVVDPPVLACLIALLAQAIVVGVFFASGAYRRDFKRLLDSVALVRRKDP